MEDGGYVDGNIIGAKGIFVSIVDGKVDDEDSVVIVCFELSTIVLVLSFDFDDFFFDVLLS